MQGTGIELPGETFKLKGSFHMVVRGPDGVFREERHVNNLVVSAGKAIVAGLINSAVTATSTGGGTFRYLAIGASSSATAAADTTLGSEFSSAGGARVIATSLTRTTTTVANDTAQLVVTYTCSAGGLAVVEAGIFDSSSGGNMLARQPFAVINLSSGDSLQTTWKVQVS